MKRIGLLIALLLVLGLAACGGGGESAPAEGAAAGSAAAGEKVFNEVAAPACGACHSLEPGKTLVGPSLADIGTEAGSRVSGQSAEEYLRAAIVDPNATIVAGFSANLMPTSYGAQLSEQQIQDLVAYLLSLK